MNHQSLVADDVRRRNAAKKERYKANELRETKGFIKLIADPAKNFVVIMKDGKVYKNLIR